MGLPLIFRIVRFIMITLAAHELCWINGSADDPEDQCAHGKVAFEMDGMSLIKLEDGEWTVSASALFLLRTLTADHTPEHPVAEGSSLFPCCGCNVWLCGDQYPVMCMGCNEGIDTWIRHEGSLVHISAGKSSHVTSSDDWSVAVKGFAKQIEEFYAQCSPKVKLVDEEDRKGWAACRDEWRERTTQGNRS